MRGNRKRGARRPGTPLATIEAVRAQPPFRRLDLCVYALLAGLISLLLWLFVFSRASAPLRAVEVWHQAEAGETLVFRYVYAEDTYFIDALWRDRVSVEAAEAGYEVTIAGLDGGDGFNALAIEGAKAYMRDANCSRGRDCTHFPAIRRGEQVIICVPHHLMVYGIGDGEAAPTPAPDDIDILLG